MNDTPTADNQPNAADHQALIGTSLPIRTRRKFMLPTTLAGILVVGVVLSVYFYHSFAATATNIAINGGGTGAVFAGVGAISGGGGNSRYLNDYPAASQTQIMNDLFKPNYAASLQVLKVEVGGDMNSTDGAEASIEHTNGVIDCNAGYEWSVMEQAKALNPNIKLYALSWGAPGWMSGHTFNSADTITYLVNWLGCAKQHGLAIDYMGGQNEKPYSDSWYEQLRTAMNNAGYGSTVIIAGDQAASATTWNVASDMAADPTLKAAIGAVGAHDICNYPTDGLVCTSTSAAQGLGIPLWASELGHMNGTSVADMARAINRGYQDAKLTGYIMWPMMDAMPPGLPHEMFGLVTADEPWSGYFTANNMIWGFAHTTQFTQAGWKYVDSATGYFGGNRTNGSYVTYKSPNGSDWSMVAETSTATSPQAFSATISGGLNSATVHVWASNLNSTSPAAWFAQQSDVVPNNGVFSYTLQPGYLYTFTTTIGQSKGAVSGTASASNLKLPVSNSFASMDSSNEANYFATMAGAFEGRPCGGGIGGTCLQQNTPVDPIEWGAGPVTPYTLVGDNSWGNYTVSSQVLFTKAGSSAGVIGRYEAQSANNAANFNGYLFQVTDAGTWTLYKNFTAGGATVLTSGSFKAPGVNTWHTVSLSMTGNLLNGSIDGTQVTSVTDSSYRFGPAGLDTGAFTSTWPIVQFHNFVATGTNTAGFTGPVWSGVTDRCLDDYQDSSANNGKVDLYSCNLSAAQYFNAGSDGTIRINGKCLDIYQAGKANGTKVELYSCNGGTNQQWTAVNGTLVNPVSGKCLDDPGSTNTNGTQIDIYTCDGAPGQYWTLPQ